MKKLSEILLFDIRYSLKKTHNADKYQGQKMPPMYHSPSSLANTIRMTSDVPSTICSTLTPL
jgi:hypothetical protein